MRSAGAPSSTCGPLPPIVPVTFRGRYGPSDRASPRSPGRGLACSSLTRPQIAALAALDLAEAGVGKIAMLDGGIAAGARPACRSRRAPDAPPAGERIDFVSFTHGRHDGNAAASRQYLAWEIGLVAQLDAQERAVFRV